MLLRLRFQNWLMLKIKLSYPYYISTYLFLQKAMVQYTIFKTVLLYLLKFIRLYEHQQETNVPF